MCLANIISILFPVLFVAGILTFILFNRHRQQSFLSDTIKSLGGNIRQFGDSVFSYQGKEITARYIPGSKNRSPELKISIKGDFGSSLVIRYETWFDKFFKRIGLNVEPQIVDREANDKLYFECDDQDFVNRLFLNPDTKSEVFNLLREYTRVVITPKQCLLSKYPAPKPEFITKEGLLNTAQHLVALAAHVPKQGDIKNEAYVFKIAQWILGGIGSIVLLTGIVLALWAGGAYVIVDTGLLWQWLTGYIILIGLGGCIAAFFIIKGFATSARVFIIFSICFIIGVTLCARFGSAYYNASGDESPLEVFDQTVSHKYTTHGKNTTYYHMSVLPWREGRGNMAFSVDFNSYQTIQPGITKCRIQTKAGRLGYEWIVLVARLN